MYLQILAAATLAGLWAPIEGPPPVTEPGASLGAAVADVPREARVQGVSIRNLTQEGPAEKAGLKKGDIIVRVDDIEIKQLDDLIKSLAPHKRGDKVTVRVSREGKEQNVPVTLAGRNQLEPRLDSDPAPAQKRMAFLGVQAQSPPGLNLPGAPSGRLGVLVTDVVPDSPAAKAGIRNGDLITKVNGKMIADSGQLRDAIREAKVGNEINVEVGRGETKREMKVILTEVPAEFAPPNSPGFGEDFRGFGGPPRDRQRVQELERRVRDLENRLREVERRLDKTSPQ